MRVRWGQVLSRSLGTGVCTSSLSRSSVWGLGGLPLQVAPCCLHPWRGGLSALHPAGGEISAQGAGPGAELLWRLMAARPQGRQEVGQDLGHRAWRAQPGLPPPGASCLSPLRLARGVQSGAWGPGAPPLLSLGPGRSTPPWGGAGMWAPGPEPCSVDMAALSAAVLPWGPWVLQRPSGHQRLGSSSLAWFLSVSSKHAPRFHVYTHTGPDPDPDPDLRLGASKDRGFLPPSPQAFVKGLLCVWHCCPRPDPHEQARPSELPLLGLSGPHTADSRPTRNTSSQPLQGPSESLLHAGCGGHCR